MGREVMDRRVGKTKKQLRQALTNLLLEKDIKEISVKELAERADVNRGTFYLHYQDIHDLYKQIQDEMFEELRGIFEKHLSLNRRTGLMKVMSEAFEYLAKNKELCIVILSTEDSALLTGIIELGKPKTREEWASLLGHAEPELYEYYYAFITSGCVGLLRSWLTGGMKEPPSTMAKLAGRMLEKAYIS